MLRLAPMLLLLGPSPGSPPQEAPKAEVALKTSPAVSGINRFALDLFREVRSPTSNVAFSPASIAPAIAMVYEGSRGATAEEIARVFHFPADREALRGDYRELLARWDGHGAGRPSLFLVENSLWGQLGYEFRPEYLQFASRVYGAPVTAIEFRDDPESARRAINVSIERETHHLIPELIGPGGVRDDTRFVMANAVYFRAKWTAPFRKEATSPADFRVGPGKTTQAPTMRQREEFAYAEADDVQVLEMTYRGDDFAMVVVLPRKVDGLDAVEKSLTTGVLDGWIAKLSRRDVILHVPKFRSNTSMDLARPLASLGMRTAFDKSADFTGIVEDEPFWISSVIHQAVVRVDEEETEAAAATAIVHSAPSPVRPPPPPPVAFKADHPFLYLIRDLKSGAILFLGHVVDPSR